MTEQADPTQADRYSEGEVMRSASEIAEQICGCAKLSQHRRDVALIEAARNVLVREIVTWMNDPTQVPFNWPPGTIADEIERKYLSGENRRAGHDD